MTQKSIAVWWQCFYMVVVCDLLWFANWADGETVVAVAAEPKVEVVARVEFQITGVARDVLDERR